MKKLLLLLLSLLSLTAFAQQKKVAVYVAGDDEINGIMGDYLVDEIAHDGKYIAVERTASFLNEMHKEQSYQQSGSVDDSEISRLGKQFGVDYVCVATPFDLWNEKYISARMIDVERAEVIATSSAYGAVTNSQQFLSVMSILSNGLLSAFEQSKLADAKKVAVYVTRTGNKDIDIILGDQLVAGFAQSGRYLAIERTQGFLDQISKEKGYQEDGAVDDEELMRVGKQFGVQYVCVAKTSQMWGDYYIATRLIDVEHGEVVNSYKKNAIQLGSSQQVVSVAKEIASKLSDKTIAEQLKEEEASYAGHEYVDLGLSVKWATCNVGASKPEEYGDYFAWGETQPKSNYDWNTYKWCNGSNDTQTKYNTKSNYGTVDNKTTLDLSDDAARANWGGNWRMPTKAEQDELRNNCTWTWTTQNGVNGCKVTSKSNGNSIFLPAAGYRGGSSLKLAGNYAYYWSSSLDSDYPDHAYPLYFYSRIIGGYSDTRYDGNSVRPVCQ